MKKYTDLNEANVCIQLVPKDDVDQLLSDIEDLFPKINENLSFFKMSTEATDECMELIRKFKSKYR